jgi:anti-sigma B factor antagonist
VWANPHCLLPETGLNAPQAGTTLSGMRAARAKGEVVSREAYATDYLRGGEVWIVAPSEELDLYAAPALREELLTVMARGTRRLVVDLLAVTLVDSTALGVLVEAARRMRSTAGSMALVCRDPDILKVLEITGLSRLFTVYDSISDAVGWESRTDITSAAPA